MNPSAAEFNAGGSASAQNQQKTGFKSSAAAFTPSDQGVPASSKSFNSASSEFVPSSDGSSQAAKSSSNVAPASATSAPSLLGSGQISYDSRRHASQYVPAAVSADGHGTAASVAQAPSYVPSAGNTNPYSRRHAAQYVPPNAIDRGVAAEGASNPYMQNGLGVQQYGGSPDGSQFPGGTHHVPNGGGSAGAAPNMNPYGAQHAYGGPQPDMYGNFVPGQHHEPIQLELPTSPMFLEARRQPRRVLGSLYMPAQYRNYFQAQVVACHRQLQPDSPLLKYIPKQYNCAYPLDVADIPPDQQPVGLPAPVSISGHSFPYPTKVFKVSNTGDGHVYALRRVDKLRTTSEIVSTAYQKWKKVLHPGIVVLHRIFTQNHATFFVHGYHPGAVSLKQKYIDGSPHPIHEPVVWNIISGVFSAIFFVHRQGLALRCCNASRILVTGDSGRAFIGCVGVMDVLDHENKKSVEVLQREDLLAFGKALLCICSRTAVAASNVVQYLEIIQKHYSADLCGLIMTLVNFNRPQLKMEAVMQMIASRTVAHTSELYSYVDNLEYYLSQELENGRLFSLMLKLQTLTSKSGADMVHQEQAYLLKLFQSYVFDQRAPTGKPVVDLAHSISCLNKLDAGSDEKIMLSAENNKSLIIASYRDIQHAIEVCYRGLVENALNVSSGNQYPQPAQHFNRRRGGGRGYRGTQSRGRGGRGYRH